MYVQPLNCIYKHKYVSKAPKNQLTKNRIDSSGSHSTCRQYKHVQDIGDDSEAAQDHANPSVEWEVSSEESVRHFPDIASVKSRMLPPELLHDLEQ